MSRYVATFHTHLSAMLTCRALTARGVSARMAPVPRVLSSSCGTCVFYESENVQAQYLDEDLEAVYVQEGTDYRLVLEQT